MKNTLIKSIACSLILALAACDSEEKVIDKVFDEVEQGAFTRIISIEGTVIDLNDTSSAVSLTLAYQDGEDNTLLDHIDYSVTLTDNTVSGTDLSGSAVVGSAAASSFTNNQFGEPQTTFTFTYGEALTALGLDQADIEGTDSFEVSWEVFTTDGRSYTKGDVSGDVAAVGGYYSSPFFYSIAFKCGLTDTSTLFDGDFVVNVDGWEDYGEGDLVPVIPDPNDPLSFRILGTNNPYIENPDTFYFGVTVVDEDGTVEVASNEPWHYISGGGTVYMVDVVGSGSINTCTGYVNIDLTFVGFGTYNFQIEPAN
ncbi:hypothetical protein [Allomuricauda sp. M10]|uniref:hypothetical protein n=1 Tax=Allomuricauda sp. M10 TaxID=2683292 RepID=UPI001D17E38F|nr:hypothetical protein [Muricauda sp. M10]